MCSIFSSKSAVGHVAAADLIVLVSNNIGGSANGGTTGNWIKLQITVRSAVGHVGGRRLVRALKYNC